MLHTNLVLVDAPDAAHVDALLERADLRNRLVRRLGPTRILVPRGALTAVRKRLGDLDMPSRFLPLGPTDGVDT